jgi:hypothetical protein
MKGTLPTLCPPSGLGVRASRKKTLNEERVTGKSSHIDTNINYKNILCKLDYIWFITKSPVL